MSVEFERHAAMARTMFAVPAGDDDNNNNNNNNSSSSSSSNNNNNNTDNVQPAHHYSRVVAEAENELERLFSWLWWSKWRRWW